jgi:ComF family protein
MLLDILFPKTCLVCNKFGSYVCIACAQKLEKVIQDICPYCKRPSLYGKTHKSCEFAGCVDGLMSVYRYRGIFAHIIRGIKYKAIRSAFGNIFNTFPPSRKRDMFNITSVYKGSAFIPIPLHMKRLHKRGFNQATIIARYFGQLCDMPVEEQLLFRVKSTPQQAKIHSDIERYANIQGAFSILKDSKKYDEVFIVDDVWTTGATIKQAAAELKKAGCKTVYAFTLARK